MGSSLEAPYDADQEGFMSHSRIFAASLLSSLLVLLSGCSSDEGKGSAAPAVAAPLPPEILGILPERGPVEGGTTAVITGKNFRDDAVDPDPIRVWFGLREADNVLLLSGSEIRVVAPPGSTGIVDVRVVNDDGKEARLAGAFTYEANLAPQVDSIDPIQGPNYGLTKVKIKGSRFEQGAEVRFGGSLSQQVTVLSPELIEALTPYGPAGTVALQVKNPDNQVAFLPRAFTFQDHFRIEGASFSCDLDRLNPGRTDHPINVPVTIKFNRTLDPASVTNNTFSLMTREGKRATGSIVVKGDSITFQPDVRFEGNQVVFGFNTGFLYLLDLPDVSRGSTVMAAGGEPLRRGFTWELNTSLDPKDFNNAPPRMSLKVPVLVDPKVDRAKLDTEIVLQFDEVVMPAEVIDPAAVKFEVEVSGLPTRLPVDGKREAGVDQQVNGTFLRFTPDRLLPSLSKVWITADPNKIHDIVGKALDASTKEFSFLTESGSGYQSAITESFDDTKNLDWAVSGASWGAGGLRPGRLGDSGVLGTLEVLSGTQTINTNSQLFPGTQTLTGSPITVTDGVFRFDRIRIAAGATLRLTGTNPARFLARGGITVDGKIEANGETPAPHNGQATATTGGPGGKGVLSGGSGGQGGSRSGYGSIDGLPGADLAVPPGHPRAAQAAGTGGKGSPANPAGADPNKVTFNGFYGYYSQQVSGGGGGGSFFTLGTKGSSTVPEIQFPQDIGPGGNPGALFPVLPLDAFTPSSLQMLIGGSGGGGAGVHAAESSSFSTKEWHPSAGGGGGGGALLLQAGGDLYLTSTCSIEARGGSGGGAVAGTGAAVGGGGSGGSVLIQAARTASFAGAVNVSGGVGPTSTGATVNWKSLGGNGGAGYIRVEHDPMLPHTSLTGFVPAATAENSGLLAETNPVTGATSLWYNTFQVKVTWLRVEIKAKEGTQAVTYSDNASAGKLMTFGVTPIALFAQGAVLDQNSKPTSITPWTQQVATLNTSLPLPLAIRFTVILDTTKLLPGQSLEIEEIKILYSL